MPNNYFQFKQFTVWQDRCAMKVCTDACLFGAIASQFVEGKSALRMLDIGTGTGLLSLMCAQKNNHAIIDAVEIDDAAAQQAKENFAASPWVDNLTVQQTSIQQFAETRKAFGFIISNPPFFENDLKSDNDKRNLALHSSKLSLEELLTAIEQLLTADGIFGLLLPYHRNQHFERLANAKGFNTIKKITVKQTPKHAPFRSILFFCKRVSPNTEEETIIIKDEQNNYTPAFASLLKDYYLFL